MTDNPLKQYFRRPAVYIKLPSNGVGYPAGALDLPENGEVPIYPMTAIDDITARTPDALYNGSAVADIIKSCVPNIIDPWKINNIDLDAILIAIRSASGDGKMDIETTCPKCEEISNFAVDLVRMLTQLKSGDYEKTLQVNELGIKFKPLTYKEINHASIGQIEVQRAFSMIDSIQNETEKSAKMKEALTRVTTLTMEILSQAIEYIETPTNRVNEKEYILDFLKNCDRKTFEMIRDHIIALREVSEIKPLKIKCQHCEHEYEQPFTLNMSDFFA